MRFHENRFARNHPDRARARDDLYGDETYYGGARSQREEWDHRAADYGERDRRERMYDAGGRDFEERLRDYDGGRDDWRDSQSPLHEDLSRERGTRRYLDDRDRGSRGERRSGFLQGVRNFFGVGPKGYRRSDERVLEDVCEALARHPEVDASDIEVRVSDGDVILTGTVENRRMKRQAEEAVETISGVRDVRVELTIPRNTDATGEIQGNRPRSPGDSAR